VGEVRQREEDGDRESHKQNIFIVVHVGLLGCNFMWNCRLIPVFWRNIPFPSSGLKLETLMFL
jgi:hypothetical protein